MTAFASPADVMRRALELARRGEGFVEPNPMVGAVIVDNDLRLVGEAFHERFGGPHAEINALAAAGAQARNAILFVTLEPCCHQGKTPPCVDAVIAAGIGRVVIGMQDPYPEVAGRGIARLRQAGIDVEVGLLEPESRRLTAPFRKLVEAGLPWVHAKWAMTLDGKIASRSGHSRWISNEASRAVVHALRGRMDAIVIGIGTALADDPLLTARPPGPRVPTRVVLDSHARLPVTSQLARTVVDAPLLVVSGPQAPADRVEALRNSGVEVITASLEEFGASEGRASGRNGLALLEGLRELGRRRCTNVLVEGGSAVLGSFFDRQLIDEVHAFVAPKLLGGAEATTPIAGAGLPEAPSLPSVVDLSIENLGGDTYIRGRVVS